VLTQARNRGVPVVGSYLAAHHFDVAELAGPAGGAGTPVAGPILDTGAAPLTGTAGTPVHQLVTVGTREACLAVTFVSTIYTLAGGAILAGPAVAGIDPALAVRAGKSFSAETCVVVYSILAETPIHAGAQCTVLIIGLAVDAAEAKRTRAGE
jgi:hypothetical protein